MKNILLLLILSLVIFDLFSQEDTRKKDQLEEKKKYAVLIKQCEQNSKAIMDNLSKSCVNQYFYDLHFDSTGLWKYIKGINEKCNLDASITGYVGNFVEFSNTLQKKVIHCVYEKEMDCGDWYFQFSYEIEDNQTFLIKILQKSANKSDDMITNVLYHN